MKVYNHQNFGNKNHWRRRSRTDRCSVTSEVCWGCVIIRWYSSATKNDSSLRIFDKCSIVPQCGTHRYKSNTMEYNNRTWNRVCCKSYLQAVLPFPDTWRLDKSWFQAPWFMDRFMEIRHIQTAHARSHGSSSSGGSPSRRTDEQVLDMNAERCWTDFTKSWGNCLFLLQKWVYGCVRCIVDRPEISEIHYNILRQILVWDSSPIIVMHFALRMFYQEVVCQDPRVPSIKNGSGCHYRSI